MKKTLHVYLSWNDDEYNKGDSYRMKYFTKLLSHDSRKSSDLISTSIFRWKFDSTHQKVLTQIERVWSFNRVVTKISFISLAVGSIPTQDRKGIYGEIDLALLHKHRVVDQLNHISLLTFSIKSSGQKHFLYMYYVFYLFIYLFWFWFTTKKNLLIINSNYLSIM